MALRLPVAPTAKSQPNRPTPALASRAIGAVIDGPLLPGRVLGVSRLAVWIAVGNPAKGDGGACVVLGTSDAVRLPNSLTLAATSVERPFAGIESQQPVLVGDGSVQFERVAFERVRWWDPRPKLPPTSPGALRDRLGELSQYVETDDPLGLALVAGDVAASTVVTIDRLGGGPGLTPYQDDVVSGALAAMTLLGEALGGATAMRTRALVREVGAAVCPVAWQRTTTLSATLLRHAVAGEVAMPVGRVLRALAGDGDLVPATDALLRVGHSSGLGLTKGLLMGAHGALAMGRGS